MLRFKRQYFTCRSFILLFVCNLIHMNKFIILLCADAEGGITVQYGMDVICV